MLTNKITGFSADLLNTVRGILGEAKKCPTDCECEKCEAEDEKEEAKEGYMPTADEPTDANKKTADKVRAMMAKEKKPVKEEAKENLPFEKPYKKVGERKDEYGNKVKNVAKYLAKKAMKANEEIDPGLEAELKATRVTKKSMEDSKKTRERASSMKEDSEHTNCGTPDCCGQCDTPGQIDELSTDTLSRYKTAATADANQAHRQIRTGPGRPNRRLLKRTAGGYAANRAIERQSKKTNEEVEELDEVSKATLGRYINKAKDSIDATSWKQGYREAARKPLSSFEKKLTKRHKGISMAVKKLTKEEADQIDELSKKTLGSYIGSASADKSFAAHDVGAINQIAQSTGTTASDREEREQLNKRHAKRSSGIGRAVDKLTKEEQDFVDSLNNEIFEKTDPYDIAGMIKKAKAKNDPNHPAMKHVAAIEDIKKHGGALSVQGDHVRSLIKALGEEVHIEEGEEKGGGYDGMPKGLQDRAPKGRARNAMGRAIARKERNLTRARMDRAAEMKKEEVEQIDEISKGTAMKALQHVSSDPDDERSYTLQKKIGKKWPGMKDHAADASYTAGYGRSGRNIFQDRDKLADRAKTSYRMTKDGKANKQDLKARFRKEEVELDEARGRPRKAGAKDFTIHPKTKEKLMHNNPADMKRIERLQKNGVLEKPKVEAGQHIMNQLQKAKTSMLGGSKINFTHGDSKEVSGPHAAKILTKYAGMKPNEKEDFQKFVGHSHENLMKHV
jgi:hypothetical protein